MTNRWFKLIKSLHQKKYRKKEQLFIVEGEKNVLEVLQSNYEIAALFYAKDFFAKHETIINKCTCETDFITEKELKSMGTFQTNSAALAVVKFKNNEILLPQNDKILLLDEVRDPGNLGTIIRIADWYNITKIVCSETSADCYNPKVIAASMGSFARVKLHYCNISTYLENLNSEVPILGAFMNGESIHKIQFSKSAILVLGNESNGISEEVAAFVSKKITIPRYGKAESLNVAMAGAIICDVWSTI